MGSISIPTAGAYAAAAGGTAAAAGGAAAAGTAAATAAALTTGIAASDAALAAGSAVELGLAGDAGVAAAAAGTSLAGAAGGASLFTFGNAATVAGLFGSGASAYGQHQAGVAQADDAKMRARQAGLEAGQKQIGIRENMLKALASQNTAAGQGGIGTGGSFGANVNRQITQSTNDLLALNADTSATESQYGAEASNAMKTGNIKAGASLLDAAGSLA